MVDHLKIGPYSLALLPLYAGPLPEVNKGAPEEPVALLLVQAIADEPGRDIAAAIREGRSAGDVLTSVAPAADPGEDSALRAAWAEKTGESLPPGAVASVGMLGREGNVPVSWAALRQGLADLQAARAAWRPGARPLAVHRLAGEVPAGEHRKTTNESNSSNRKPPLSMNSDLKAEVGREPAELIARRREFLRQCRDAGVFAPDFGADREEVARLLACLAAAGPSPCRQSTAFLGLRDCYSRPVRRSDLSRLCAPSAMAAERGRQELGGVLACVLWARHRMAVTKAPP